ncbi:hypothetical protein HRG_007724 [Hirsutella rhossiliensis]|uniref:Uncharacterized protein n=1 Tax=Hirsutella rhossiliensis TaxID=111463 RepID=A0A9P8MWS2_9HYPO|nr:uncharacterized protein HRG_07724 [Hirsutella rhossiliensis]KAH0961646.1 hypothetical protein HRG_07724 [Hirsutella rhossiliensis]
MLSRHRSESRTSNVSKKRTDAHKPRLRPDPERKMLAMHQVAQYWNECIQIAEDERNQANWEIERLQRRLQRQDLMLSESRSLLKKKECELEDAERHCHQLEENYSHRTSENQRLSGEVETLRSQLFESQTRATELRDKQRQIRDKLNEAIHEQQDLYKRSQTFYEDSMSELRKENEKRVAESTKVDEALEKGRQKREEMMRCLQELRDKMDRENRLKEETISELRRRVQEQEDNIRHEREVTESLRRQIELQEVTQHTIEDMASQMESLLKDCTEKTLNEQRIQGIGDAISTQVVSSIADVACNQERAEQRITGFGFACGRELSDIKRLLGDQDDNRAASQALEEEGKHQIRDALENLESRMRTALDTFQRIEQFLEERFQQEFQFREDEIQRRQADLDTKLAGRDERVGHLEQQLQLTSEAYAAKVEALANNRASSDEDVQNALHKVFTEFRSNLDEGFFQEKERSEEHLRQNQTALAALESQLRAVNDHLTVAKGNGSQNGAESSVHDGNALVSKLQRQVRDLEKQAKATEELRGRWQRDIQTVDALRGQLREIQHRVPQMERFDMTLGKMARMNEILHSTAQYLTHERHWALQHLEKAEAADGSRDDHSADEADAQSQGRQHPTNDRLVTSIEIESLTTQGNPDAGLDDDCDLEEAPFFRRKVTVYSPAGEVLSPSPPPSVHQEQMRRRGAAQPRSILKLSATSSQDAIRLQEQATRINLHQSQYNRPVVGRDRVAAASAVVEQIRAELVPSERSHLAWSLPTVADFERDGRFACMNESQKSADMAKRRLQGTDDAPSVGGKRAKLDADASVMGSSVQAGDDAPQHETHVE